MDKQITILFISLDKPKSPDSNAHKQSLIMALNKDALHIVHKQVS